LERHFFLAPDGSSYSGRKQAVEYMKKINASQDDIKKMESGFKVIISFPKITKIRYSEGLKVGKALETRNLGLCWLSSFRLGHRSLIVDNGLE
jgi:hypothetical protein